MPAIEKIRHILAELKGHAPFTIFGAVMGIVFMLVFSALGKPDAENLFRIFHPAHVILSAMVTASLFRIHEKKRHILVVFIVGYTGSVGIATLSDSVVPYIGENLLGLNVPTHADLHTCGSSHTGHAEKHEDHARSSAKVHIHTESCDHPAQNVSSADHDKQPACGSRDNNIRPAEHSGHAEPAHQHQGKNGLHLGFIEDWYIVNPAAILGVLIAFFIPRSKCPHAAHVLISTWASSAHILMNSTGQFSTGDIAGIFVVLFIAVWLPCCISDIIFPLLFVGSDLELTSSCTCPNHAIHSHEHTHCHTEQCGNEGSQA